MTNIEININKLEAGMVFKSWRDLFAEVGVNPKAGGESRKAQIKEIERYCTYHKEGYKIVIDEVFSSAKEKVDGRCNNGKNHNSNHKLKEIDGIPRDLCFKRGVYSIVLGNDVYIGSTTVSFYYRWNQHKAKSNHSPTYDMLKNGAKRNILWIADDNATEKEIRQMEQKFIDEYAKDERINLVNVKSVLSSGYNPKHKHKKKIVIDAKDYDFVINLLLENGIMIEEN